MKVRHYNGATADVPEAKAAKLVEGGSWTYSPESLAELARRTLDISLNDDLAHVAKESLGLSEPQEEASAAATIPEMRAWALKNEISGVKEKGKLSREAIEAYQAAHKE